jgi:hypothetical protein
MSEDDDRLRRALRAHDSFEPSEDDDRTWTAARTPFDVALRPSLREDGRARYRLTVRLPALSATTEDDVAPVVEDGWYETFDLRVRDVGDIFRGDPDPDPSVSREGDEVLVTAEVVDIDPRRAADDASAFVNFVEGTYVQGVIPGYDYHEPVSDLLESARQRGGN